MKKVIAIVIASFLGLAFVFLLNFSTKSLRVSGIDLPFGWEGPHYWLTTESPNDHSSGLPFTMFVYDDQEGAYYSSNLAMGVNAASGIGLGLLVLVGIGRLRDRTK